jgi:hypothetical protein
MRNLIVSSLILLLTACSSNQEDQSLESSAANSKIIYAPAGTTASFGQYLPPHEPDTILSRSYNKWEPTQYDTCTKTQHSKYWVKGPGNSDTFYPTWHPPFEMNAVGTILCYYGHEHGSDPRRFAFYSGLVTQYGGVPFGYVNEQLAEFDPAKERVEDHVGHKIEHKHYQAAIGNPANGGKIYPRGIYCDFLAKLHMGTHSSDAFHNHLHEYIEYRQCTDGTKMAIALLLPLEQGGRFRYTSGGADVETEIDPEPASSDTIHTDKGSERAIPPFEGNGGNIWRDDGVMEVWTMGSVIDLPNSGQVGFGPYIAVFDSARVANPTYNQNSHNKNDLFRYSINYCYDSSGKKNWPVCASVPNLATPPAWDSPDSPFNGTWRDVNFKGLSIYNISGQSDVYTDFYGTTSSFIPFAGSIKQYVAVINNGWDSKVKKDSSGKVLAQGILGSLIGATKIIGDPYGAWQSAGFGKEYRIDHATYRGKPAKIHAPN